MKKKVFIRMQEHMDPLWRRCFDRDISYKGQSFVPYSDLEAFYIEDSISLCKEYPFYKFELESVVVLKKFLEKHPEYEEDIARLVANGQMHFSFSGNNIIDSNMVQGESIVRNLLNGYQYLKNKYDYTCEGLDRMDAFGNAAQLPQIARGFGSKWVKNISYVPTKAPYWEGVDGSRVFNLNPPSVGGCGSFYKYRPCPVCKGLRDHHCEHCNDRRIDVAHMEQSRPAPFLDEAKVETLSIPGYMNVGGEEILPTRAIVEWAQKMADKYDISFATFQDYLPYYKEELEQTDTSDDIHPSPELNPNSSGCFVSRIKTKQCVRRLENRLAAAETLCVLKMLQDRQNGLCGQDASQTPAAQTFQTPADRAYPEAQLNDIWEKSFFAMFHDCITGTHVDPAYEELMDICAEAENQIDALNADHLELPALAEGDHVTIMNPNGINLSSIASAKIRSDQEILLTDEKGEKVPLVSQHQADGVTEVEFVVNDLPAFAARTYAIAPCTAPAESISVDVDADEKAVNIAVLQDQNADSGTVQNDPEYTIENEFYLLMASRNGILEVFDKKLGRTVAAQSEYLVGEWILEHDEGSPWATLSTDMRRTRLSPDTRLIRIEKNADVQKLTFRIKPANLRIAYSVFSFDITYSVSLIRNSDIIHFASDVRWETFNHRLRIAFPSAANGAHFYEVPYAFLERKPYAPQIMLPNGDAEWNNASGDYPAINWAGIQSEGFSLALFNKGTPSYQINTDEKGTENIYLSVLRSPSVPTCLHEPLSYSMQDYDGMRDSGVHHFEYALKSYGAGFSENTAVADGIGYNPLLPAIPETWDPAFLPAVSGTCVRISALKRAEDQKGLICRLVEYRGKDTSASVTLPGWVKAVYETDLKEDVIRQLEIQNGSVRLDLHHFGIKTLYLTF